MKHIRALSGLLLSSLMVTALVGCTILGRDFTTPGRFNGINEVVQEIDLEATGEVVYEARTGTYGADHPTYICVIEGDDALDELNDRLEAQGFELNFTDDEERRQSWQRGLRTTSFSSVRTLEKDRGDRVSIENGRLRTMESSGIAVYITD